MSFIRVVFVTAIVLCAVIDRCVYSQSLSPTTIEVSLPADAELWVNGGRTTTTGELREFRDSQARPGAVYRYELRAVVESDGQQQSQTRVVRLAAGQSTRVEFDLLRTTSLKPLIPTEKTVLAQRSQFQPRPSDETDLPELPAIGTESPDGFQPREPDLGDPTDDGGIVDPDARPEIPEFSDPTNPGGFGRQFGDEPDAEPTPADGDLPSPELPADPMEVEKPTMPAHDAVKSAEAQSPLWAAYIGGQHEHHLTGNTGTALHVWNHAWRMVRLQHSGASGPYILYTEADRDGFDWAYGRLSQGCNQCPVYFKPGAQSRWYFVGFAKRVRSLSN